MATQEEWAQFTDSFHCDTSCVPTSIRCPPEYGALSPHKLPRSQFLRVKKQRLNVLAILLSAILPWLVFCVTLAALCFSLHYTNPGICYMLVCAMLCIVLVFCGLAANAIRKKRNPVLYGYEHNPNWHVFVFLTAFLAWVVALGAGDRLYTEKTMPYFSIVDLNTYQDVDPMHITGRQLADAGRVTFVPDVALDLQKSMGFKDDDVYCVAPIVTRGKDLTTYDLWAVGVNCCSGSSADFHCGAFKDPLAHGALRLMNDHQRPYYRLAVQQAEAAYNIQASHPVFFEWVEDANAITEGWSHSVYKTYVLLVFTHLAFQTFSVVVATLGFAKLGHF